MAATVISSPGGNTGQAATGNKAVNGGRFDFDDGGTYCGGWEDGKAHGHGVCTGPKSQGEYSGSWHFGFEVSGIYTWPSGSTYEGQWQNGKRHGLGVEARGRWLYRGEWTQGFKGRYGVRQSTTSAAKYEGTWANGLQDGYGSETYADAGTFKGQWLRGLRHGYGVRTSAQFGQANITRPKANNRGSTTSLRSDGAAGDPLADRDRKVDDGRGGFVLRARSDELPRRRGSLVEKSNIKNVFKGLKMRRQRSTGDIQTGRASGSIRSTGSSASWMSTDSGQSAYTVGDVPDEGSNASFVVEVGLDEQLDASVVETYMGEWKNDKRSGFGVSERSDGLKYEGEWYNNKKYGYGVTTFKDGTKEEGKYKNNVLITSNKKKHVFLIRSAKFRERIEAAVAAAQRAAKIAMQKEDIAISRTATARGKAEQADISAVHAREDSDIARIYAKQFAPDFHQPGEDVKCVDSIRAQLAARGGQTDMSKLPKAIPKDGGSLRSKSLYERGGMDDYLSNSQSGGIGGDSLSPPPGGGATYTNYGLGGDPGGSRRVSVNPGEDHLMGNAVDNRSRTPMRTAVKGRGAHDAPSLPSNIMNDRFDHYNRPPSRAPSRERSEPRFASRGTTPVPESIINPRSRAPSQQRTPAAQDWTPDSGVFEDEIPAVGSRRPSRPPSVSGEAPPLTGNGSVGGGFVPYTIPQTQQEAESLLRQRACGQQITPTYPPAAALGQGSVKRTESLYINPVVRHQAQVKPDENSTDLKSESSPVLDEVTETVTENVTLIDTVTKTTDIKDDKTDNVKVTDKVDEGEKIINVVPSGTLSFMGPFTKVVTSELKLTNTTDKRVCFKVKTTAPRRYYVRPKNGIVDPYETVTVAVMLQPFDDEPEQNNRDKFMIQSLYAPDGRINLSNIFRMAEQTGYYYSKLFCKFTMPLDDVAPNSITEKSSASQNQLPASEIFTAKDEKNETSPPTINIDEKSPSKNVRFSPTPQQIIDLEKDLTINNNENTKQVIREQKEIPEHTEEEILQTREILNKADEQNASSICDKTIESLEVEEQEPVEINEEKTEFNEEHYDKRQELIEEDVEEYADEINHLELQSNLIQEEALFLRFLNNTIETANLTEPSATQDQDDQVEQLQSQVSQLTTECPSELDNETATAPPVLKRKKSLPDSEALPLATSKIMSREEASVLSSAQRNEFRRQAEEAELYRANPLLYITSPTVQDWFSRQRLVMLILFLNLSLALMFFKLLS